MKRVMMFALVVLLSMDFDVRPTERLEFFLRDGRTVIAEILNVRDSSIVVTTARDASEGDLMSRHGFMTVISDADIDTVMKYGDYGSNRTLNEAIFSIIGGTIGFAVGASQVISFGDIEKEGPFVGYYNALHGAMIGCGAGMFFGCAVTGEGTSDLYLISAHQRDFTVLSRYQRYPREPDFMKQLAR